MRLAEAAAHGAIEARFDFWSRLCGGARLVLFALLVVLVVRAVRGAGGAAPAIAWLAGVAFVLLVLVHGRILAIRERARRRRLLAQESAARLGGGIGPGAGARLTFGAAATDLDAGHAVYRPEEPAHTLDDWVLDDLAIEGGSPSLRALLDTTSSELGARRLRRMLHHPLLDAADIRARQEAIRALHQERALRDDLTLAYVASRGVRQSRLAAFLALPRVLPGGILRFAVHLLGVACPILVAAALQRPEFVPGAAACLTAVLTFGFAFRARAGRLRDAYLELEPVVRTAQEIAPRLGASGPGGPVLQSLRDLFTEFTAAGSPHRLPRVRRQLQMLHLNEIGFLYGVVQLLTLWDLHWLFALEAEVKREPGRFARLGGALADLEALGAIATFADEQPGTVLPEILADAEPRFEIVAGEHPLLPFGKAVPNDFALGGTARLAVVTGSNMSGKSTFLRMVALDVVLAQIGAPVRAAAMRLVPVSLHASIHVRDSLADGKSYFLVEVERVREILRAAGESRRILGVFDELFRGTNSRERLAASREIARHLAASGGLFLLATHDQELAHLALEEGGDAVVAVHFRDEIDAGKMVFPYRLEPGVASTTNAIRLLEISGYPESIVKRARASVQETAEGS